MNFKDSISSIFEDQFLLMICILFNLLVNRFYSICSLTDVPSIPHLQDGPQPSNYLEDHPETCVLSTVNISKVYVAFPPPQFKAKSDADILFFQDHQLLGKPISHTKEHTLILSKKLHNHYTCYSIIQSRT